MTWRRYLSRKRAGMVFPPQGAGATGGALANLGTSVFSGYPLLNQTDFLAPWGAYDYYIRIIAGSPNQYQAYNNQGNKSGSQSTDAAVVVNAVLALIASTGGRIWREKGLYNINSLTKDPDAATSYYAYGYPSNTAGTTMVDYVIDGPGGGSLGVSAGSLKGNTIVDYVTTTALTGISTNNAKIWYALKSPGVTRNNRIVMRGASTAIFPVQAANRQAFDFGFATEVYLERLTAGFDVTFANYVAPSTSTAGFVMPLSGQGGQLQYAVGCQSLGYFDGWEVEDLTTLVGCTAIKANVPIVVGKVNATYHSLKLVNFMEHTCINSIKFDTNVQAGFLIDATYDIQYTNSGAFAKGATLGATEVNPAFTRGIIRYDPVLGGTGVTDIPFWVAASAPGGCIETYSSALILGRLTATASTLRQDDHIVAVDATAGNIIMTLPAAAVTEKQFIVYKKDAGVNTVTVTPLEGGSAVLTLQYSKVVAFADGSGIYLDMTKGGI